MITKFWVYLDKLLNRDYPDQEPDRGVQVIISDSGKKITVDYDSLLNNKAIKKHTSGALL